MATGGTLAGMTCKPMALVDDVVNAFNDYVCDSADAVEQALKAEPALKDKQRAIEQGVDCWQLRLQRSADQSFDEFELRALQQILRVPDGVQEARRARHAHRARPPHTHCRCIGDGSGRGSGRRGADRRRDQ